MAVAVELRSRAERITGALMQEPDAGRKGNFRPESRPLRLESKKARTFLGPGRQGDGSKFIRDALRYAA